MKDQYDFSEGERGKFFNEKAILKIPVFLDSENFVFVEKIATKKQKDISTVVNELIRSDRDQADVIE
jgi:thioredoxin-related protein